MVPASGILNWTLQEIQQIDIQTRRILRITGNFHRNSYADWLYLQRKCGGRDLKLMQIAYELCVISIRQHLRVRKNKNRSLEYEVKHEQQKLMRVENELLQSVHIDDNPQLTPRDRSQMFTQLKLKSKAESFESKPLHGYGHKTVSDNSNIDEKLTREWTTNKFVTSNFEATPLLSLNKK